VWWSDGLVCDARAMASPAEEFEGDLTESVFWGADLSRAVFRDVDLSGVAMRNVRLADVDIDGSVERLVINGVDVTDYVNAHDPWQPLRGMLTPTTAGAMRATAVELERSWASTIEQARHLTNAQQHESVGGEWSFVQTLRHLVFAIDKWFTVPLDGGSFHPIGIPNTGSADFPWPGLDPTSDPSIDEVLAVRADRIGRFHTYLDALDARDARDARDAAGLSRQVEVMENGTVTVTDCMHTVFEEEFEHRRYAMRDLAALA